VRLFSEFLCWETVQVSIDTITIPRLEIHLNILYIKVQFIWFHALNQNIEKVRRPKKRFLNLVITWHIINFIL